MIEKFIGSRQACEHAEKTSRGDKEAFVLISRVAGIAYYVSPTKENLPRKYKVLKKYKNGVVVK